MMVTFMEVKGQQRSNIVNNDPWTPNPSIYQCNQQIKGKGVGLYSKLTKILRCFTSTIFSEAA